MSKTKFSVNLLSVLEKRSQINLQGLQLVEPHNLRAGYRIQCFPSISESILRIAVILKYFYSNKIIAETKVESVFEVQSQNVVITEGEEGLSVLKSLLETIIPVAFDSARGFICASFKGSVLMDYPFPMIKTGELVKNCEILDMTSPLRVE